MANLSKFHVVFSSSTLIRLDKDVFEGHLCQTVNNFVKQNKSSLLSPLRKRRPPQHIKHIRNTRVSRIPTFDEPSQQTVGEETIAFGLHFAFVFPLTDRLNGYVTNTAANIHVALSSHRNNHLYITYFHVL